MSWGASGWVMYFPLWHHCRHSYRFKTSSFRHFPHLIYGLNFSWMTESRATVNAGVRSKVNHSWRIFNIFPVLLWLQQTVINAQTISKCGPRPEKRSVPDVVLEGWLRPPPLHGLLLQDGDPADVTQQEPNEERRHHANILGALHHRRGREPETRPLQDLPKVVGMSAVGPQPALDEFPLEARKSRLLHQMIEASTGRSDNLQRSPDPFWRATSAGLQ